MATQETQLEKDYRYARINGYRGTFAEYVERNWEAYQKVCADTGVQPMPREQWEAIQASRPAV